MDIDEIFAKIIAMRAADVDKMFRITVVFTSRTEDVMFDSPALVPAPPRTPAEWAVVLYGLAQLTLDAQSIEYLRQILDSNITGKDD